jgi:hypothetical protein
MYVAMIAEMIAVDEKVATTQGFELSNPYLDRTLLYQLSPVTEIPSDDTVSLS